MYYMITKNNAGKFGFEIRKRETPDGQGELICKNQKFYETKEEVRQDLRGLNAIDVLRDGNIPFFPPIATYVFFRAGSVQNAVTEYVMPRSKIDQIGLDFAEVHIESFNMIGDKMLEHDIEEPINLSKTTGTRYFSKFSNIANDKSIAVRTRFSNENIKFDIVDIKASGVVSVDADFKIFRVFVKRLTEISTE